METYGKRILAPLLPLIAWYAILSAAGFFFGEKDASFQAFAGAALGLPVFAVWYMRENGALLKERSGDERPRSGRACRAAMCLLCGAAGAVLSALSAFAMRRLGLTGLFSDEVQEAFRTSSALWLILGPGILSPICEEFVYRGLLYGSLRRELPRSLAMAVTAFIFAAGHGNMIQFLYALPMGFVLCLAGEAEGGSGRFRIVYPVMMHLGANLYSAARVLLR